MSFKAGALGRLGAGHNGERLRDHGAHIRRKAHHTCPGAAGHHGWAEPRIKPGSIPFRQNAGIKLVLIPCTGSQRRAVRVGHVAVIGIPSGGRIAHGHRDCRSAVQRVIEIIPAIRAAGHIGRIQTLLPVGIAGVLGAAIQHAFIPPVGQILYGRAPAHIIVQTEIVAIEPVMASKHIHPPVEHMRLPVGHILPQGQIGIDTGMFH